MKNVIWIAVAAVVAVGAYVVFTGNTIKDVVKEVTGESVDAPEALDSATDAAGEAAEEAIEAAEEVVEKAAEAVEEAVEAVTGDAAGAVAEAVEEAVEAVSGDAAGAATDAVEEAVEAVTGEAVEEVTEEAGETDTDALSVDGFNMAKVSDMIDGSDLGDIKKTLLKATLKKAQDNPELLKAALDQVKSALGM